MRFMNQRTFAGFLVLGLLTALGGREAEEIPCPNVAQTTKP
jgi:hypothetical protein